MQKSFHVFSLHTPFRYSRKLAVADLYRLPEVVAVREQGGSRLVCLLPGSQQSPLGSSQSKEGSSSTSGSPVVFEELEYHEPVCRQHYSQDFRLLKPKIHQMNTIFCDSFHSPFVLKEQLKLTSLVIVICLCWSPARLTLTLIPIKCHMWSWLWASWPLKSTVCWSHMMELFQCWGENLNQIWY